MRRTGSAAKLRFLATRCDALARSFMKGIFMSRYQQLNQQHQAALAELEAAKRRCRNPVLAGGVTDPATLDAFSNGLAEIERWKTRCSELALQLAACDPTE
jgi:hypothetical protein